MNTLTVLTAGVVLLVFACSLLGQGEVLDVVRSNQVDRIGPFPLDFDSGGMALDALEASFKAYGLTTACWRLAGVSGAAFKFVYDSTEAYEPLRGLYPVDVLRHAASAFGFREAHWETNQPIEVVRRRVKTEIDLGHPVIAPFLKSDAYHGFFIITGYDFDAGIFYLQGAFGPETGYVKVPIPDGWDGPTAGPDGWAGNPIFVLGKRIERGVDDLAVSRSSIEQAIETMKGGWLGYGSHPGAHGYTRVPGPHKAAYGLEAYRVLVDDTGNRALVQGVGAERRVDFGFLWRIDAQVGQLKHDRENAMLYLRQLATGLPADKREAVESLISGIRKTVGDATRLRRAFWQELPGEIIDPRDVDDYVRRCDFMVFKLPDSGALNEAMEARGYDVFETPWGWILVDDVPEKRLRAKMLAMSIWMREKATVGALEGMVGFMGGDAEKPRPDDRGMRRRKR